MPVSYQIVPEHIYPHQMVQINDNSEVVDNTYQTNFDVNSILCVFSSPKGRDGMYSITSGSQGFINEYGEGSFANYGQPYMQAFAAASSGAATLQCLRVTADDATYAASSLMCKYSVEGTKLKLEFSVGVDNANTLTDLDNIEDVNKTTTTGTVRLFTVASMGKGAYGNNIRWRVRNNSGSDKQNNYKNYIFDIYEQENGGLVLRESFAVAFSPDAIWNGESIFFDEVINDVVAGSNKVRVISFPEAFKEIFDKYKEANPDTKFTVDTFDCILGIDKYTRQAEANVEIAAESVDGAGTSVSPSSTAGLALGAGSDGALALTNDAATRQAALDTLYTKAFNGEIDEYIKSKNRYPVSLIIDANYPVTTKRAMVALATKRTDCMVMLDCGTGITTKASVLTYVNDNLDDFTQSRIVTIEPYCMKVRDPMTKKSVVVTSGYWLSRYYPVHIKNWNGKHKPFAGNKYGIIEGAIRNSVYPTFDEDLDSEIMDELAEKHINFAKYNANRDTVRAMQDTRNTKLTNLSEQNNMLIVLDIKRDAEQICAQFEFEFAEAEDIARYNTILQGLVSKYNEAQVRSISAVMSKSDWESKHNIIHLVISLVHKDLVRTTIIEIDVNRDSEVTVG